MNAQMPDGTQIIETDAARLLAGWQQTDTGTIGHLRFNLPEKHNIIDLEGWQGISRVMAELAAVDNIRLIVLRGIGGKAFVAGADIAQFEEMPAQPDDNNFDNNFAQNFEHATGSAFDAIANCPVPTLAAIEGFCIGGGLGIAAACDLRLARDDSRLGIPAGKLGLAYPANATQHLVNIIGRAQAKRILFTATRLTAETALRIGLVHEVIEADNYDSTLKKWVAQITANAPMSLQVSKFIIDNPQADASEVKKRLADCLASADYEEGRTAFMQKRQPIFTGK